MAAEQPVQQSTEKPQTGLVLTGGGARAAYQVGVLKAIAELLPDKTENPFPIICGTSAGAINAVSLACFARDFGQAVGYLRHVWEGFHAHHVYRSDPLGIARTGAHWLGALMAGWVVRTAPKSLLDNAPLAELLKKSLNLDDIGSAVEAGALRAICITASGYGSGQSVNFYDGVNTIEPWTRHARVSCRCKLTVEHLLASSAIPFIFPAVLLNREFFGDGSMRQLAPISPAIHLGANRVLVIAPSERLDTLAAKHVKSLPWPVRMLLRGIGAMNRKGSALASYLLFEQDYTRALIDLGYADTMARREEVMRFLA